MCVGGDGVMCVGGDGVMCVGGDGVMCVGDGVMCIGGDGVEGPVVALCCALEILVEDSKLLHEVCLQWRSYMAHYPLMEHTSGVDVTVRLQQTLCHQTALYCTKLMKVSKVTWCSPCDVPCVGGWG